MDGCEIPARLRAAVKVRQIADVFPFGTCRQTKHRHRPHRTLRAHGLRWAAGSRPGSATWARLPVPAIAQSLTAAGPNANTSPATSSSAHHRMLYLVTNQGTLALGRTTFSAALSGKPLRLSQRQPSYPQSLALVRGLSATAQISRMTRAGLPKATTFAGMSRVRPCQQLSVYVHAPGLRTVQSHDSQVVPSVVGCPSSTSWDPHDQAFHVRESPVRRSDGALAGVHRRAS